MLKDWLNIDVNGEFAPRHVNLLMLMMMMMRCVRCVRCARKA